MFDWQNVTELEQKYIDATTFAKSKVLELIPKEEIVSIYLVGSFARREINKKSDIDTITVLKTDKFLDKFTKLNKESGKKNDPQITFSVLTLDQMKSNTSEPGHALPDRFLKRLNAAVLLYGEPIDPSNYPKRNDEEELIGLIKNIRENMTPRILKREMGFQGYVKNALWLAEAEYRLRFNSTPKSWREILEKFNNSKHIANQAMAYRNKNTQDDNERKLFTEKVEKYMQELEEKYL